MRGNPVSSEASAQQTLMSMSWSSDGHFVSISHSQNPQWHQLLPELKWSSQREISENLLLVVVGEKKKKKKASQNPDGRQPLIYSASTKRWYSEECCQKKYCLETEGNTPSYISGGCARSHIFMKSNLAGVIKKIKWKFLTSAAVA